MKSIFSDLPKSIRIQMYATYSSLILLLVGIFLIEYFFVFLVSVIVIISISFIYPFLEETNIIRQINKEKIAKLTLITETEMLPVDLELRINHYDKLEEWIKSEEEKEEKIVKVAAEMRMANELPSELMKTPENSTDDHIIEYPEDFNGEPNGETVELPAGSGELLEFIENPIKKRAKKYLEGIQARLTETGKNIYMLLVEKNEDMPNFEFEQCILISHKKLSEITTYPSGIYINDYYIECRSIRGNAKLVQIIDNLPIFLLTHLWDDDFENQKDLELKRKETPLERVKDKIIQTLLAWRFRDIAHLRKSEAEIKMWKENFELVLQELQFLKLGIRYEREPIPWYMTLGWIAAAFILILSLVGVI